ncbi:MAG: O-methyltransferase [Kineosporiaceae bacterium]
MTTPPPADGLNSWDTVDSYLSGRLLAPDPAREEAVRAAEAAGLPDIQVSPLQGALLHILARSSRARRVLEIGTLGGYSTLWLARALPPDGLVVTLEVNPHHADTARATLEAAGLGDVVEVRVGAALAGLATLEAERADPFDLVFVDADKQENPRYLEHALRLTRPGSLIVVDNVVRDGAVADGSSTDPAVIGTRAMIDAVAAEPRLTATAVQTVGVKGYDGLLIALVTG